MPTPIPKSSILVAADNATPKVIFTVLLAMAISMLTTIGPTQAEEGRPAPAPMKKVPDKP